MVTITLYLRQQKRHWCIEQSFGLCGRGRGWEDLGEWHWNTYNIIYETSHQSRFDARYWMLGAGALGRPRGMVQGGRREEGSGWGTCVYLWQIHVDIWQNQYNIVKLYVPQLPYPFICQWTSRLLPCNSNGNCFYYTTSLAKNWMEPWFILTPTCCPIPGAAVIVPIKIGVSLSDLLHSV